MTHRPRASHRQQPQLLHRQPQHRGDLPALWSEPLQLLQCVFFNDFAGTRDADEHHSGDVFAENACPHAYVYAYDEKSGALFTCPSSKNADYTVTFCP